MSYWDQSMTVMRRLSSSTICFKETKSVTMNIFKKTYLFFKSFVKIKLCYVFTMNMFSAAENCMEKWIIYHVCFSLVGNIYVLQ